MGHSTRLYSAVRSSTASVAANTPAPTAALLPATQTILNTVETVIADPGILTNPLLLSIPPGGPLEQEPFEVTASGYLNHGTSSTVTLKLYSGSSLTVGSDTLLGTSGAISAFAGKVPFWVKARLQYDSVSGKMNGTISFMVNNTLVAEVAVSNVVTGLNNAGAGTTGAPVVSFVLSATFGTGGTQVISVKDFGVNH